MSPILDLQQRITERGRIRLGTKVSGTSKTGKAFTRPAKSETFLLSSHDRTVVDVAAAEWDTCGTVEEFDAGWRVDTGRTELDVIIPPAMMAFSQWLELWGKGYCSRRCDGQRETISDGPCQCDPDPRARECKTTTRLSVMLPDLPGFGLWRVESHGYYAAAEIKGAVDAVSFLAPNTLVRGRLIAAAREVVRFDRDGKPQTNKFVVPVLDLPDVRLRELIASDGGVGVAIESPARGGLSPVPQAALPESSSLSVAEQISQTREAPRRRSNAAAVLPPTGLAPGSSGWGEPVPPPPPAPSPGVSTAAGEAAAGVRGGPSAPASGEVPASAPTSGSTAAEDPPLDAAVDVGGGEPDPPPPAASPDTPITTADLYRATGKTSGAAKLAVKRASEACGSNVFEAADIVKDQDLAARVLEQLGGGVAPDTVPWKDRDEDAWSKWNRRCQGKAGPGTKAKPHPRLLDEDPEIYDEQRHAIAYQASRSHRGRGNEVTSWADLTETECLMVEEGLDALAEETAILTFSDTGSPGGWVIEPKRGA